MIVTRDVARDLLPLVLAGEASEDSKKLVEQALAADPALAREADALRAGLALPPTPAPPPSGEKRALDATRALLRQRSSTFAVALLFTVLPLSFAFRGSEVTFLLIRDAPIVGLAWWATAAVMWGWHFAIRRRLRVSGL
jgi:anti-sigma factor RsiW